MGWISAWTLESESVWRSTHRVGGASFVLAGLLLIAGGLVGGAVHSWLIGLAFGFAVLVPLVYSYVAWKKEQEIEPNAS